MDRDDDEAEEGGVGDAQGTPDSSGNKVLRDQVKNVALTYKNIIYSQSSIFLLLTNSKTFS